MGRTSTLTPLSAAEAEAALALPEGVALVVAIEMVDSSPPGGGSTAEDVDFRGGIAITVDCGGENGHKGDGMRIWLL